MKLADVRIGEVVTIGQVTGEGGFRRRLMELGLVPGTQVEIVGAAPLGDPLELLVRGSSLSIRRGEAQLIEVGGGESAARESAVVPKLEAPVATRVARGAS
jgi:ferrous iron transport protein A